MKFENSNGQVLQFYVHYISAKYHNFRSHTFEEETFGSYDFLIGHWRVTLLVTIETLYPKCFWNQVYIVACINFSNMPLKEATL